MNEEPSSITDPEYLLQQYTRALAEHDCGKIEADIPDDDHDFWAIWRSNAEAVLKVRDRYLEQLRQRLELVSVGLDPCEKTAIDDLSNANIDLARELAARNAQLGRYLLHLENAHKRLATAQDLHRQNCPVARGMVKGGFTCAMCEALALKPAECTASVSGNCLREAESETACDTEAGECVHGGRPAGTHIYLSTGCLHEDHGYCQSMTGIQGSKRGGTCKFCEAPCICTCHTKGTG